MARGARARLAAGLAAALVVMFARSASAHEPRRVGSIQMTVGWGAEPVYAGVKNTIQLILKDAKGAPIDDLGPPPTLQVTVTVGSLTSDPLPLLASFDPDTGQGTHGEFDAAIIPTAAGTYTFRFTGTVEGQKVDERFTSSDKTFDDVKEPSAVEFPAKPPGAAALATNVERLNPRVDNASATARAARQAASSAKNAARTATILAIGALVVALAAGSAGIINTRAARRGRP